ncbi:MAG: AIR synthase-related protein, partial [Lentisphaeria bacterium]|nr:AIR synthase-related protein [Lentisphaeria bacterium]
KVLFQQAGYQVDTALPELSGGTIGDALLVPHRCYWPAIRDAMAAGLPLNGIAHITGGGLYDNVPRVLPTGVGVVFDPSSLPAPPVFSVIQHAGDIDPHEMYRVFNMGVGMVWFVPPDAVTPALDCCRKHHLPAAVIGQAKAGTGVNIIIQ